MQINCGAIFSSTERFDTIHVLSSCRKVTPGSVPRVLGSDYMANFSSVGWAEKLLRSHDKFQPGLKYKPGRQI